MRNTFRQKMFGYFETLGSAILQNTSYCMNCMLLGIELQRNTT